MGTQRRKTREIRYVWQRMKGTAKDTGEERADAWCLSIKARASHMLAERSAIRAASPALGSPALEGANRTPPDMVLMVHVNAPPSSEEATATSGPGRGW